MDSILNSIKKLLGIAPEYTQFDVDIIIHINSVLNILHQLGLTKANKYSITDSSSEWSDIIDSEGNLELIKSYIFLKVRMLFDPPTGSVAESYKEMIKELEWRINNEIECCK